MFEDAKRTDPNDLRVVEFHNASDFDFTPELGAMYNGSPLFVSSGERKVYPYHIANRLAENLAKAVMVKGAPAHDPTAVNPVGTPLWDDVKLDALKNSYLKDLYMDERPIAQSETEKLLARVSELEKLWKDKEIKPENAPKIGQNEPVLEEKQEPESAPEAPKEPEKVVYKDKQEIISELEKREIPHDKRSSKADLEKLLNS